MTKRNLATACLQGVCGLMVLGLLPASAVANDTCNGLINVDYVGAPPVTPIGDTVDLEIRFGTGSIQGGTSLTLERFALDLDCNASFPLTPPCTDEGPLVQYEGDATISSNCPGIVWTTGHAVSPNPNRVMFTASPALVIPANQPTLPGFCSITFRVRVLGSSVDVTPGKIEQLVGYDVAACDNGVLLSGGFQTSAIETPVAPHFSCYEIVRSDIPDIPGIVLEDRFGTTTVTVKEPKRLCTPTSKNGEDPLAPLLPDHLVAYTIDRTAGSFVQPKDLQIANQFGVFTADLRRQRLLMTPSVKSFVAPPPPPLVSSPVPHFQCYGLGRVDGGRNLNGLPIEDQFAAFTVDLSRRGPFRLCVPVNKNNEDPAAPANPNAMLCTRTRDDTWPLPQLNLFVNNQFGPAPVQVTQYDDLCIPSTILD